MIYNSTVLKNEYKEELSNSTGLNILRLIQISLAFISITWMNGGAFTYVMPYLPNYLRWGLFLAWFCLALTSNKKFAKIFAFNVGLYCYFIFICYLYPLLLKRT